MSGWCYNFRYIIICPLRIYRHQIQEKLLKFCPNPECPFFLETALIAEFKDSAEVCLDCQTSLVEIFPDFEQPITEALPDELYDEEEHLLVTLATYLHQAQARLLRNRLVMVNIHSHLAQEFVEADSFSGAIGRLQLLVRESDFEQAIEHLERTGDE